MSLSFNSLNLYTRHKERDLKLSKRLLNKHVSLCLNQETTKSFIECCILVNAPCYLAIVNLHSRTMSVILTNTFLHSINDPYFSMNIFFIFSPINYIRISIHHRFSIILLLKLPRHSSTTINHPSFKSRTLPQVLSSLPS